MTVLILIIGILTIAILLKQIFNTIKWFQFRNALNKIPGPYSYYIVGNVADLAGSSGILIFQFICTYDKTNYKIDRKAIPKDEKNYFHVQNFPIMDVIYWNS